MTVKITPVGSTEGHIQVGSGLPIEIDTAGNLSTPGNVRAAPATADGDAVTFEQAFGVGQSLVNVTGSRAYNTVYTNTTGKLIGVQITAQNIGADGIITGYVNDVAVQTATFPTTGVVIGVQFSVPPGGTYKVGTAATNLVRWEEYR